MSDNTTINLQTGGNIIRTEEIGGVHYQAIKVALGIAGVNDGDLSETFPMPTREQKPEALNNLLTNVTASGAGSAVDISGLKSVLVEIRGITTAVISIECSHDGTNWDLMLMRTGGTFTFATTTTANGNFLINVDGYKYIRANVTSYGSGTITATAEPSNTLAFMEGFFVQMNTPTFENDSEGYARFQKKYTFNPTGAPLRGTSLFGAGSAAISIKNAPGALFAIQAHHITSATELYFQIHDKASAPASSDVPIMSIPAAQYEKIKLTEEDLTELGLICVNGIACGWSSTKATYTAHGTATDCYVSWRYQ